MRHCIDLSSSILSSVIQYTSGYTQKNDARETKTYRSNDIIKIDPMKGIVSFNRSKTLNGSSDVKRILHFSFDDDKSMHRCLYSFGKMYKGRKRKGQYYCGIRKENAPNTQDVLAFSDLKIRAEIKHSIHLIITDPASLAIL